MSAAEGEIVATRLDTSFTYADPESLRRFRVGDLITGGLSWTRPVRLGGAQVGTDFALRPDLVTFPVPAVGGQVAVPSTVDLLVNGVRVLSREVEPGPFAIRDVPVVSGAGEVSLVVENAQGRETLTTLPFYASNALLTPGLTAYSVEAGAVRREFGLQSNDYAELAGAATLRRGLTSADHGVRPRGRDGERHHGGLGATVRLSNLGTLDAAAALSGGDGGAGYLVSLGFERVGRSLSFAASTSFASEGFGDIASAAGDPVARWSSRASAGLGLGRLGSLALSLTLIERYAPTRAVDERVGFGTVSVPGRSRTTLGTFTWSTRLFADTYVYLSGYSDLEDRGDLRGGGRVLRPVRPTRVGRRELERQCGAGLRDGASLPVRCGARRCGLAA